MLIIWTRSNAVQSHDLKLRNMCILKMDYPRTISRENDSYKRIHKEKLWKNTNKNKKKGSAEGIISRVTPRPQYRGLQKLNNLNTSTASGLRLCLLFWGKINMTKVKLRSHVVLQIQLLQKSNLKSQWNC